MNAPVDLFIAILSAILAGVCLDVGNHGGALGFGLMSLGAYMQAAAHGLANLLKENKP